VARLNAALGRLLLKEVKIDGVSEHCPLILRNIRLVRYIFAYFGRYSILKGGGRTAFTMPTREELKELIDRLPERSLEMVRMVVEHHIHPPEPRPAVEQMRERSKEYREKVMRRFSETRKPGTGGGATGSGFLGEHKGIPFGRQGFHYWDDKALVYQSLQHFDGQEIEIMQRLSFSTDRTALICSLEIASGGQTLRHEDAFPIQPLQ
jgi:hypothetical protein